MKKFIQLLLVFAIYTNLVSGQERSNISSGNLSIESTTAACETITASGYQDNGTTEIHPPEHAFDGDINTKWTVSGVNNWVQVDYCDNRLIKSVKINFPAKSGRSYYFSIDVSLDGTNYTEVFPYTTVLSGTNDTYDFNDVGARYVRINAKGNSDGGGNWNNYTEIVIDHDVLPTEYTISASAADGYVSPEPNIGVEINNHLMIGKSTGSDITKKDFVSAIIPFQLPARTNSSVTLKGAKLTIYVAHGRKFILGGIDLYGLKYKPNGVDADKIHASDHFIGDFYLGTAGGNTDDYGIEENLFSKNSPFGYLDVARYVEVNLHQQDLVDYINAQYINGAEDGDWVFLRLTPDATMPDYFRFYVDAADGNSVEDYDIWATRTPNANQRPKLQLNYSVAYTDITTVWDGSSWSNGIPNPSVDAIIDGNINVGPGKDIEDVLARSVEVKVSATINVFNDGNFVVEDNLTIKAGGSVIINSGGAFKKLNDSGVITVETGAVFSVIREARSSIKNYTYWSSPVNTTIESALIATGSPKVWKYITENFHDSNGDSFDDNGDDWGVATGAMSPGIGYAARASNLSSPVTQTVTFTAGAGTTSVYTGDYTVPVKISPLQGTTGWNLLGNPFSSGLSAFKFTEHNKGLIEGSVYFWSHSTEMDLNGRYTDTDYAVFNATGTSSPNGGPTPNGIISSGQSFFVNATVGGTVEFKSSTMQVLSVVSDDNNVFFKKGKEPFLGDTIIDRVWFNLSSDELNNQILVGFLESATDNFDSKYDAVKMPVGNEITFYSYDISKEYVIQGKPSFNGDEIINLGFVADIVSATSYKIGIDNIEGVLTEMDIILKDNLLGKYHNLKKSNYEFEVEKSGTYNDRFEVSFVNGTLSTENTKSISDIRVYPNPVTESFEVLNVDVSKVELYNVTGDIVLSFNKQQSYNLENLSPGVYLIRVTSTSGEIVNKKIIRN